MATRKRTTRERVMTLLAREREVYNRKTRTYERAPIRVADVAKELRVSIRTVRRWKNEGVEPRAGTRKGRGELERLKRIAAELERKTARDIARDRKKHKSAIRIERRELPVLPVAHRRKLKDYTKDKRGRLIETGSSRESSWNNYSVRGWTFREAAAFLVQVWRQKRPFQFIYEVPAGGQLPKSGSKPPRTVRKLTRAATAPINPFWFHDEAELLSRLNQYIDFEQGPKSRRLLYIAVDDQMPDRDEPED